MFNSARITELEAENRKLKEAAEKHDEKVSRIIENHKIETERTRVKHEDAMARGDANLDTKVAEKTATLTKEITKLTIENESNKQKVSMYEKAFENLGFDVKDMKDILNKLVDGIVSKNEIKVLNTGK